MTQEIALAAAQFNVPNPAPAFDALIAATAVVRKLTVVTRNVAHSLLKFRIRVNGLNIGWMSTEGEDNIQ